MTGRVCAGTRLSGHGGVAEMRIGIDLSSVHTVSRGSITPYGLLAAARIPEPSQIAEAGCALKRFWSPVCSRHFLSLSEFSENSFESGVRFMHQIGM